MDACRLLLKAIDAGVPLDDILEMDTDGERLTRRLTRLVRLGLVTVDPDDTIRVTDDGQRVLRYIAPEQQWQFLRATVAEDHPELSLASFELLASRIVAHVPAPLQAHEAGATVDAA